MHPKYVLIELLVHVSVLMKACMCALVVLVMKKCPMFIFTAHWLFIVLTVVYCLPLLIVVYCVSYMRTSFVLFA